MKLDRIRIKGFKSIEELDLGLEDLNVLIGANGAGKSNFISVFKLLNQLVEENLQLYVGRAGGASTLLHFGQKITNEIRLHLDFGKNGYQANLITSNPDTLIFSAEGCSFQGLLHQQPYNVYLGNGHKETKLHEEARKYPGKIASHVLNSITSWKIYHFHDTSDSAAIKQTADIGDNASLKPDASNLAAFLYLLKQRHLSFYERISSTIRLAVPFFEDFVLRPFALNPNKIQLEWREKGHPDTYFNAYSLSDGTLRFMCLATLLLQPSLPSTILIDEPELGLHPYAITLLADLLKQAATKTQVIVSTQSVPLVNQFLPEDIVVVDREKDHSVFRRLEGENLDNWLEDYGLGDLWEKNILGGRPAFR